MGMKSGKKRVIIDLLTTFKTDLQHGWLQGVMLVYAGFGGSGGIGWIRWI
jgi:hypothetical protein